MDSSTRPETVPQPIGVKTSDDTLSVDLADGRTIAVPLGWFPRLKHATAAERERFELGGFGIHWPDLDEDISVAGLLAGRGSCESPDSLKRWLETRAGRRGSAA